MMGRDLNESKAGASTPPVAVVGVSALFPGALTTGAFWRDILEGRDRLTEVPRTHWLRDDYFDPRPGTPDKVYTTRGGFLPAVDFAPLEFGLPPNTVPSTDTAQLLALVVAKRVLAEATRGRYETMDRSRMSVVLGVASSTELVGHMCGRLQIPIAERAMRAAGLLEGDIVRVREVLTGCYVPWQEATFPGLLGNVVAGRVANRLDLGGTNAVVDAACGSSLAAVEMAVNDLALGHSDLVITGGVDALNDILMFMCFAQTGALSLSGDCRPFSEDADGTMLGEGLGMVALKRLADAERDGDPVYAVIRGVGSSSDGRAKSIYAPAAAGQALALKRAYERAGYGPDTVELVEAHGTATRAGDAAEFEALKKVFEEAGAKRQGCALGSIKGQIGHTKAAAGSAGLIKVVMALHHKVLPPTIKVKMPSPGLQLEKSPFYLNTATRPWLRGAAHPRRASVSALGFGGTNFHVTVEEYLGQAPRPERLRASPTELVLLSAADAKALAAACRAAAASASGPGALVLLARRTQLAFDATAPARLAIVAADEADLGDKLLSAADSVEKSGGTAFSSPRGIHFATTPSSGPVALLFPGQGSQYVGMSGDLAVHFDCARAEWDRAADLATGDGERLTGRVFPPPAFTDEARSEHERLLTATEWAQPAIAGASLSMLRVVERLGIVPSCVGGHSLGEVTALTSAGAINPTDLLTIARRRGELIAHAGAIRGAMTAVAAERATVERLIAGWGSDVVVANHNAPAQVVLSGATEAIEEVERRLEGEKLVARRLPVSTAFHSPIVGAACAPFRDFLDGVAVCAPQIPVYSNATAEPYPSDGTALRDQLAQAIARPVRFVEQIEAMYAAGARTFVEVGPDSVLTKLVGRCLAARPHVAVALDTRGKHGMTSLWDALGRLSTAGVALHLSALWEGEALPEDLSVKEPARLSLRLSGANYGKPYPPAFGEFSLPATTTDAGRTAAPALAQHAAIPAAVAVPVASPASHPRAPSSPPAPAALPPAPFALALAPVDASAWMSAVRQLQAPTIAAQMEYQRLMAESHMAFLHAVEVSYANLGLAMGGAMEAMTPPPMAAAQQPLAVTPRSPAPPIAAPGPAAAPRAVAPPTSTPPVDLVPLMLAIVAEKTGYPAEMVELTMDLEADLGIDSIKRVEILSAVRERAPGLPEVDTARMATLRTLGEIVAFLSPDKIPPAPSAAAIGEPATPSVDLVPLMLAIVAEKTGYPAEMVELTMDLEADLGIDSIKRVEILSAVRERAPGLPEVDTARMATLRTLGEIVAFLGGVPRGDNGTRPVEAAPKPRVCGPRPLEAGRFTISAVAAPALGLALHGLFGPGAVAVTPEGGGIAQAVVERLRARGVRAVAVDAVPADAAAVIFLGGLRPIAGIDDALAVNREAFAAARAVAECHRDRGGAFVTVQDTGGDFGLAGGCGDRAWLAGLAALTKSAAEEWPLAAARAIDLERGGRDDGELADAIVAELLYGGPGVEVGLTAGGARVAIAGAVGSPPEPGNSAFEGALFVVSGGARGITAAALLELARGARPRFLLLGRTPLDPEPAAFQNIHGDAELKRAALEEARSTSAPMTPKEIARRVDLVAAGREIRETLRLLGEAGAEARYVAADVREAASLAPILDEARRAWGPIRGLVHGAGVLADALLDKKTDAQFDRVFDTKVLGLRGLLDATRGDPLEWLCLFSSVAARSGNAGQADYAMANEVLNKVASVEARRRGAGCRVVSIGWGPWEGGMVTPSLRRHFDARDVKLLPVAAGASAFVRELGGRGEVEVVVGGDSSIRPASRTPRLEADILVDEQSWPQLASHRIQGKVVLPMVVALEWFARLVAPLQGDRDVIHFRDLRVIQGVPLTGFLEGGGNRFHLVGKPTGEGDSIALELRDLRGMVRYAATLDLGSPPAAESSPPTPVLLPASPWAAADLYGPTTLFHGAHFQVLRSVEGISMKGARGMLHRTRDAGWPLEEWYTDPAALDGALQLAILFGLHSGGGPTLPMRIGRIVYHRRDETGPIRCELTERARSRERVVCDLALAGIDGVKVADLLGVEMFALPSGTTASVTQ